LAGIKVGEADPAGGSCLRHVALLTVGLTFSGESQSWNFALANDLLRENNNVRLSPVTASAR
jgi:hypothetical protein